MPRYDSLLLNCGGGIINRSQQSKQYRGAAALAIGIGGTGVAALAELKQKVYQHLEPDNPDSPVPEYQHIQFLAIDSDPTDIAMMRGMARLDREREFFSINNPNLPATLRKKDLIKSNASLNWMDIDRIGDLMLLGNLPVCPIRQVGRYLLISRASNLISTIQAKCTQALEGMTGSELDVYIFAGLSGGTGGGCFLDTCYIVQKALEDMGRAQSANVMGFFFLPDVVNSKPQVASQPATVKYYSSNGYAAMKELDYLMSLKDADDWFRQDYGTFTQQVAQNFFNCAAQQGYGPGYGALADYALNGRRKNLRRAAQYFGYPTSLAGRDGKRWSKNAADLLAYREQNVRSGRQTLLLVVVTLVITLLAGICSPREFAMAVPALVLELGCGVRCVLGLVMDPYGSYRFVYAALAACWLLNILCLV